MKIAWFVVWTAEMIVRIVWRICDSEEFVRRSGEDGDGGGGGAGGGGEMTPVLLYREPSLDSYTRMLVVWEIFVGVVELGGLLVRGREMGELITVQNFGDEGRVREEKNGRRGCESWGLISI